MPTPGAGCSAAMPSRPPVHRPAHLPLPEQGRREYDTWRGSSTSRGYDGAWRKVRAAKLAEEPLCRMCMAQGRVTEATEVHHEQPISLRRDLRLTPSNLIPLCHPCHASIEARPGQRL
ncbi:MAG: HNH endonuclease [Janthinobacterium lividum]